MAVKIFCAFAIELTTCHTLKIFHLLSRLDSSNKILALQQLGVGSTPTSLIQFPSGVFQTCVVNFNEE